MDVWVVSHMTANEGGYVIGVAADLDGAKRIADEAGVLQWKESTLGSEWTADAGMVNYYSVERFEMASAQ